MYHDYSQAYMDIMDNDPNTQSYNQFLHLGNTITPDNTERYQDLFARRCRTPDGHHRTTLQDCVIREQGCQMNFRRRNGCK